MNFSLYPHIFLERKKTGKTCSIIMIKLFLTACYGSTLGSNPDIPQKSLMGDINKGVADTL
jgi:hypothetical protein